MLEYAILPVTVGWTWLLFGELPDMPTVAGIVLIIAAGLMIVLRGSTAEDRGAPESETVLP
ncbi:hypothetical protein [Paracoccus pacificus]|uniref:EamA-like transporter family protein n=1 Tax=Paracoccus pacificus TaxID=1463598 RepID=A0ABW4RC73_9RHOB